MFTRSKSARLPRVDRGVCLLLEFFIFVIYSSMATSFTFGATLTLWMMGGFWRNHEQKGRGAYWPYDLST
ncbi:hypothetical protein RYH73_01280 [Olivibacter sp. CPCC 100613]|uniref:hypothetical protein n=1 Tax=Olivibacter sp. CPCC 100613 TaxID=3079931 RepID=UPI002FFA926A